MSVFWGGWVSLCGSKHVFYRHKYKSQMPLTPPLSSAAPLYCLFIRLLRKNTDRHTVCARKEVLLCGDHWSSLLSVVPTPVKPSELSCVLYFPFHSALCVSWLFVFLPSSVGLITPPHVFALNFCSHSFIYILSFLLLHTKSCCQASKAL